MTHSKVFNNKRVVITGGLGFIGSTLAKRLVEYNANVTLLDSMNTGCGGNYHNIREIENDVEVITGDICNPDITGTITGDLDYLFNLAAQTSHMGSLTDPFGDMNANVNSQLMILERLRHLNSKARVVYTSTRQVYGKSTRLPVKEDHPRNPVDINGVNKLAGESYHILYNKLHGIDVTVLRLTNTYGPRMRIKDAYQNFLGGWIGNVVRGMPIEVWGGTQLRDYNFVADVINALILAAASEDTSGKVFNLGGTEPVNLFQLTETLTAIDSNITVVKREFPEERKSVDLGDFYSDATFIRNNLGWEPETDLKTGLTRTLEYFRENQEYYL